MILDLYEAIDQKRLDKLSPADRQRIVDREAEKNLKIKQKAVDKRNREYPNSPAARLARNAAKKTEKAAVKKNEREKRLDDDAAALGIMNRKETTRPSNAKKFRSTNATKTTVGPIGSKRPPNRSAAQPRPIGAQPKDRKTVIGKLLNKFFNKQ